VRLFSYGSCGSLILSQCEDVMQGVYDTADTSVRYLL